MKAPRDRFTEGLMDAAALGMMPRSIVAAVTEAFTPDRLTLDERRFLAGPLIVHNPQGWPLPDWLADAAGAERIGIVFGVTPRYIVGPAEIAMVMFGASMDAPLHHEHADLYFWATINAHAKRKGLDPATLFTELLNMRPITNDEVLERGGRLHETYRQLAEDIRRKVVAHQAGRNREAKRGEQQEARTTRHRDVAADQPGKSEASPAPVHKRVIAEQMALFV